MATVQNTGASTIGTFEHEGRRFVAAVRVTFDGIEYVGRLWFAPEDGSEPPLPDRGAFPGRATSEVMELARRLTTDELRRRYGRAVAEKRRYLALRGATDEILTKIRYMNHLAVAARTGLLDADGASQEMQLTQEQLRDLVGGLAAVAGVEG